MYVLLNHVIGLALSDFNFIFLSLWFILALLASKILNEFLIYVIGRFSDC
jgi:hypothetical protein